VFAPLARLLGLYSVKEELEALSFKYSEPEAYALMQRRLDVLAREQEDVVLKVCSPQHGLVASFQHSIVPHN
jgi:(p)ppGpp synthase/HD superfamily hydrolase